MPKLFYNIPSRNPLFQSNSIAWRCADFVGDFANTGWNLGSGWLIRQQCLADIGGFPTDCLIEDVCSSMIALAEGWRTAYIPEEVQWGLVPESYVAHVKQMTRWVSVKPGGSYALAETNYLTQADVVHWRLSNVNALRPVLGLSPDKATDLAAAPCGAF
jgi:cellulose synthase/poly-beta-1,6-N-acetylglucosamine synthase-like glycosyltransferase